MAEVTPIARVGRPPPKPKHSAYLLNNFLRQMSNYAWHGNLAPHAILFDEEAGATHRLRITD